MIPKVVFITGGAGFIASHFAERLIENHKVIIYDNLLRNALKYCSFLSHPNLSFVEGDVLDAKKLTHHMRGADICIHAAAIAGIYSVGTSCTNTMKVNLIGAYNALESAIQNKVKRFIDFSTSEVYGPFVYLGKETDRTTQGYVGEKRWVYAVSKLASEYLTHSYGNEYDLESISIRPFNVYGPRQVGEGAVQQIIALALKNADITIYNNGTQIRSWCYITDFIDALEIIALKEDIGNQVFNIGNPQATVTVLGLAQQIIDLTNSKSSIVFKPHPGPEVEIRIPDISKAQSILGYIPKTDLKDGLIRSIEWYQKNS